MEIEADNMVNLVIANEQRLIRECLKQLLALDGSIKVVAEAGSEKELNNILIMQSVDVVLLDFSLCGLNGGELIGQITASYPSIAVLVLSMHNEPQLALTFLNNGAHGFISNDQSSESLFKAIHKVARQQRYLPTNLIDQIIYLGKKNEIASLQPYQSLSPREKEILYLLSKGKNINAIASHLKISSKTVSTHKIRMMEKMNFSNNADIIKFTVKYKIS